MEISNYIFKILVLGKASSGKTSLVERFSNSKFNPRYKPTHGLNLISKFIVIDERTINLSIWDTGGSYDFDKLTYFYFKGSSGVIIVLDQTDEHALNTLNNYMQTIESQCSHIPIIIALSKDDMEKNLLMNEINKILDPWKKHWRQMIDIIPYSSKTGENVIEIFTNLSSEILKEVIEEEKFDVDEYI